VYLDDIIIVGHDTEELNSHTTGVLQRIQSNGMRQRPEKCQFFMSEIKHLGYIFDAEGRRPDVEKI
jgi:hypothetical protein